MEMKSLDRKTRRTFKKEMADKKLSTLIGNRKGGSRLKTIMNPNTEVFKLKGQGLYLWVTESQYKLMLLEKSSLEGPMKFGQYGTNAAEGQTPQDTIDSYQGATSEALVILWAVRFTEEDIQKGTAYEIEQVMKLLIGTSFKDGSSTEVFNTSVDKVQGVFSDTLYKSRSLEVYSMRQSQRIAFEKMVEYFQNGGKEFLLGAIMRFGKNFTVLNVARKMLNPGDCMLVLSAKPGVFATLSDIFPKGKEAHAYFDDYVFVELKNDKNFIPDPNKINVIAVSTQLAMNKVSGEKTMDFLKSLNFKLAFFDECHSGQETENFDCIEKSLSISHIVRSSGTPFKTMARFSDENSFFYGYIEQQRDKALGLNNSVTLETNIVNVHESHISAFYSEEEGHTLRKMFATEKVNGVPRFLAAGEVEAFIKDVLGLSGNKKMFSPMMLRTGLDHTVWLLPDSSDTVIALKNLIESITDDYNVFAATSDQTREIKVIQDAIEDYKNGIGKKTITLTIGRFVEGTTVPEWKGAFVMSDTSSLEKYFQFIFRVCSPAEGKDKAYVFDFSKDRAFEMVYAFALATAHNNNTDDIQDIVREWLDNNNIFFHGSVSPTPIEVGDILAMVKDGDFGQRALVRDYNKYTSQDEIFKNFSLLSPFISNGTAKYAKSSSVEFNVNKTGESKAKNKKIVEGRSFGKKELTEMEMIIKSIVGLIALLPYVFQVEEMNDKTIDGIFKLSDETIQGYFGVSRKDLERLFESGIISDKKFINLHF